MGVGKEKKMERTNVEWANLIDWELVNIKAKVHNLDPALIAAVIYTESLGNTFAVRFEPGFRYLVKPRAIAREVGCTEDTMIILQKMSFGLMQVMGAVAYEEGLRSEPPSARWPTTLLDPVKGVEYGCRHLVRKKSTYGSDPGRIYAAYNAGSPRTQSNGDYVNQTSVDRFLGFYRQLTE